MFQFPGLASRQVGIVRHDPDWVAPFGNLRIYACVPLPEAYRSLPRPSSPVCAKASTIRPLTLDHHLIPTRNDSQMVHLGLPFNHPLRCLKTTASRMKKEEIPQSTTFKDLLLMSKNTPFKSYR
jgi:hypothetical protein